MNTQIKPGSGVELGGEGGGLELGVAALGHEAPCALKGPAQKLPLDAGRVNAEGKR